MFWSGKRDRNRGSNNDDHLVGRESSAEERSWSHIVFNGRLTVFLLRAIIKRSTGSIYRRGSALRKTRSLIIERIGRGVILAIKRYDAYESGWNWTLRAILSKDFGMFKSRASWRVARYR